jgi:DNA modification methylase
MDSRRDKRNTKNKGDSNKEVKIAEKLEINNIHHGDCIELLKNIADESNGFFHLIFAAPSYNLQLKGEPYRPNQVKDDSVSSEGGISLSQKKNMMNFQIPG